MSTAFVVVFATVAVLLHFRGAYAATRRIRRRLDPGDGTPPGPGVPATGRAQRARLSGRFRGAAAERTPSVSMVVLVQQLAALLRGGRAPLQMWDELWRVHTSMPRGTGVPGRRSSRDGRHGAVSVVSGESLEILAAARAVAAVGSSPAQAIRSACARVYPVRGSKERRVWVELAACLDIAEISGCPLAGLLARFAAQLEAEEDAEAARQTALAGPKATVRLLSWLPVFGLLLGMALGVDPVGTLLGNVMGTATFVLGLVLTMAGRLWSARLVAAAGAD
ncbi:hypothetical protein IG195_11790 [Arthrobacter sp. TES]|nr:hypothetical protein M707_23920 [Arthrobacter sp. AK-YN10]QOI62261.1 hypothetical protein IG195_11790 [Arthrobacter sp. TES]